VKFVLEQDKAAFIRLIGVSILQSAANSFVAPSLRPCCSSCSAHGASVVHVAASTKRHSLQGQPCSKIAAASIAMDEDSTLLVVWMLRLVLILESWIWC